MIPVQAHRMFRPLLLALLLAASTHLWMPAAALAEEPKGDIVATLDRIQGSVKIIKGDDKKVISGRDGLLLRNGDTIITSKESQATLKFRDGSEFRLFPNSQFKVEQVKEAGDGRGFKYDLSVQAGSIWGTMVRQKNPASIRTRTATIGVKGTTLRVVERDEKTSVALTEGEVEVKNGRDSVTLKPGNQVKGVAANDRLSSKVEPIPFKLDVKSEKRDLDFAQGNAEEAFVVIQLVNVKSGTNVTRSGPVYLRSNYDRASFPGQVVLNEQGFARVAVRFGTPEAAHEDLKGTIYVWAVMDREDDTDIGEGVVMFRFKTPGDKSRLRIDANSGEPKKMPK
ncbi:MAG: FecR family protein [Deltaproteobacteria bacterium]|nr:FecR family protein [Deltaproteobacteria bacterium]